MTYVMLTTFTLLFTNQHQHYGLAQVALTYNALSIRFDSMAPHVTRIQFSICDVEARYCL